MTTLDKIKLIDFYLHGVDRDLWDFEIPNYDVSLDALRPVIVKLNERYSLYVCFEDILYNTRNYLCGESDFTTAL